MEEWKEILEKCVSEMSKPRSWVTCNSTSIVTTDHANLTEKDVDFVLVDDPSGVRYKCPYCRQWGDRHTTCTHCGGPIDS